MNVSGFGNIVVAGNPIFANVSGFGVVVIFALVIVTRDDVVSENIESGKT